MQVEKRRWKLPIMLTGLVLLLAAVLLLPKLFGLQELAVISGSMAPKIPTGSMVYVRSVRPESLCPGDVCTYQLADSDILVTHRVMDTDQTSQTLVTRGDANEMADAEISFGQVVGRVEFHLPYVGWFALCVQSPMGLMLLGGATVWAALSFLHTGKSR